MTKPTGDQWIAGNVASLILEVKAGIDARNALEAKVEELQRRISELEKKDP